MLFKYIIKNKYTGVIYNKVYSISQIEEAGLKSLFDIENYEIIATLQFTSLTDKNGNRIFEGDKVKQYDSYEPMIYGKIVFRNGCFDIEKTTQEIIFKYYRIESRNIEVIGNIHD